MSSLLLKTDLRVIYHRCCTSAWPSTSERIIHPHVWSCNLQCFPVGQIQSSPINIKLVVLANECVFMIYILHLSRSFETHRVVQFQFSHSIVSDSLQPHGLQHARPPCQSPTPGVYSNSCPLSWWCYPTISSSVVPFSSSIFPRIRVFSNESALRMRWPKYWSFSFSVIPSKEIPGLISQYFSKIIEEV